MKRGTAMPRFKLKVLGKPEYTNVVIAAHAICVRTTMPPLVFVENFLGFQLQDKHNASILFQMSLDGVSPTDCKCTKTLEYKRYIQ